jgi:F0F1-type ATP synthase alpha subunit
VGEFEKALLQDLRTSNQAVLADIRVEQKLTDGTEAKLKTVITNVLKLLG